MRTKIRDSVSTILDRLMFEYGVTKIDLISALVIISLKRKDTISKDDIKNAITESRILELGATYDDTYQLKLPEQLTNRRNDND